MQRSMLAAVGVTLMLGAGAAGYLIGKQGSLPEPDALSVAPAVGPPASPANEAKQAVAELAGIKDRPEAAPSQPAVEPPSWPSPAPPPPAAPPAEELSRYRTDFLGQVSEALAGQRDVQIVGDRYVLQSDLLFPAGTAVLQPGGEKLLAVVARQLLGVTSRMPKGMAWLLQVDGHTDSTPISNALYSSNWELSTARATAVVKFLNGEGVPNDRLVVAGSGGYRPLSSIDRARNRRIEIRLIGG